MSDSRPVVVPRAAGVGGGDEPATREAESDLPGPPPVRWGVVGATSRAARLGVVPALERSPKCSLMARSPGRSGSPSVDQVLSDPAVEVVYIALPNELHVEVALRAIEFGKHVLVEKPIARSAMEAEAIATAADAAGVVALEAYATPFHPRSTLVEDLLRQERLGSLRFGRATFTGVLHPGVGGHRWDAESGAGGVLLDVGVYCIDPLLQAAGSQPVGLASAATVAHGVDVSCSGWLSFASGMAATVECSFEAAPRQRLELVGTDATLLVDRAFTPGPEDDRVALVRRDGSHEVLTARGGDAHRGLVDHVATVVRGGADIRRPIARSVEVLGVLDRMRMSWT